MRYYTKYDNAIYIGAASAGLHLRVLLPFSSGHAPLFVPWTEIEIKAPTRFLFTPVTSLVLGREARIPLRIYGRKAEQFLAQAMPIKSLTDN